MGKRQTQSGQTDYLLLLIVIIVGVAAGNLLSNWITARIALYQTEQALIEFNEQLSTQNAEAEARQREHQLMTREQRASSRTGLFLSKSCEEWKVAHQRYDNFTSKQEMDKACRQYEDYLDTGRVPSGGFR